MTGLKSRNLDSTDVEKILREITLDNDYYRERVLDMITTYGMKFPIEIKTKQFMKDLGTRLYRLLPLIKVNDSANVAKCCIDEVICDVEEFIDDVTDGK